MNDESSRPIQQMIDETRRRSQRYVSMAQHPTPLEVYTLMKLLHETQQTTNALLARLVDTLATLEARARDDLT